MIKCRIHIFNKEEFMDQDVYIEIMLPCIPQVGNNLDLSFELLYELEKKAKKHLEIAGRYAPHWFYGKSFDCENLKDENLQDLSFDDANTVKSVGFMANCDYVNIALADD